MRNKGSTLFTKLLLTLVLSELFLYVPLSTPTYASGVTSVSFQATSSSGGDIYPGSKDVSIVVQLRNNEAGNISYVEGCFQFSTSGIKPVSGEGTCTDATTTDGKHETEFAPGQIFQISTKVNVDKNVNPGTYRVTLKVSYTFGGSRFNQTFTYYIRVKPYPQPSLEVTSTWWGSSQVYPGTSGATLYVRIRNTGNVDVRGGSATVEIPSPLKPSEVHVDMPSISSGQEATVQVSGVDIPVNTSPGTYNFTLKYNVTAATSDGVTYTGEGSVAFNASISEPTPPNVLIVDAGWITASYNESRNAGIYVTMQNLDHSTIESVVATLYLPPRTASREGYDKIVTTYTTPTGFGNVMTLRFEGINISNYPAKVLNVTLHVEFLASYNGAYYYVGKNYTLEINLVKEDVLSIAQVRWTFNGNDAEAFPSAKDISLEITLVNNGVDSITAITPSAELPKGFTLKSFGGSCVSGVSAGGVCTLRITVDVSNYTEPGTYPANITLNYVVRASNTLMFGLKRVRLYLTVSDAKEYLPNLTLGRVFWGDTSPTTAYGLERNIPLHIEVVNTGRYPANNLYATLKPITNGVKVIDGSTLCASQLPSGGVCTLTPRIDLDGINTSSVTFSLRLEYAFTLYGAYLNYIKTFTLSLPIQRYAAMAEGPLQVVGEGWSNGYPAYPNTQNATYVVTLANHYPYSISSIKAVLKLPKGFVLSGNLPYAYLPGPIGSGQTGQLTFTITVGDVKPGRYTAELTVTYVVNSGGAAVLSVLRTEVSLRVEGFGQGLEFVGSGWYGSPAQPNTYGNLYYVTFRNDVFPQVKGAVAEIKLPKGFTSSINNLTEVRVPASTSLPQSGLQGVKGLPQGLTQILTQVEHSQTQSVGKGDLIYFLLPVNVLNITPGTYNASITVSFIDQWGNVRNFTSTVPLPVLGSALLIKVWSDDALSFANSSTAVMHVKVLDVGTAPVYNVYLALYSPSQYMIILPKENPLYIGTLSPGKVKVVNVTVFYNPIATPQMPTPITYGNMPFMAGLMYRDVLGNAHTLNASFTVTVKPFIKLVLQDVKVTKEGSDIRASGTITNLGNAQAQRITAKLIIGNYSGPLEFIGDLDPSSQTSFSVSGSYPGPLSQVTILVMYRTPYNTLKTLKFKEPVTVIPVTTTTPTQHYGGLDVYRLGIAAAVIAFLILAGLLIYRYLKRHPLPGSGGEEEFGEE